MRIVDHRELLTGSPDSRLAFVTTGGGTWPAWDRYLAIDGEHAYHLGNVCQTCAFLFRRLKGANTSVQVESLASSLAAGIASLDDDAVHRIGQGLPEGKYIAVLGDIQLRLVCPGRAGDYFANEQIKLYGLDPFWNLPHDPHISYYRAGEFHIGTSSGLFQFVVPMYPGNWLSPETLTKYAADMQTGRLPTAVAISILDVKVPADGKEDESSLNEHWTLTHFLIDGHHKAAASQAAAKDLRLLSFLAVEKGISSRADIDAVLNTFKRPQVSPECQPRGFLNGMKNGT